MCRSLRGAKRTVGSSAPRNDGVYPDCKPILRKCPPGTTGVYPPCKPILVPPKHRPKG
jgi:hypothetical protein